MNLDALIKGFLAEADSIDASAPSGGTVESRAASLRAAIMRDLSSALVRAKAIENEAISPPSPFSPLSPIPPNPTHTPASMNLHALESEPAGRAPIRETPRYRQRPLFKTEESLPADVKEVVDTWNGFISLPRIHYTGIATLSFVTAALQVPFWKENWRAGIIHTVKCDFLKGKNGGWRADIKWLCDPENLQSVLAGKYDNRKVSKESKAEPEHFNKTTL